MNKIVTVETECDILKQVAAMACINTPELLTRRSTYRQYSYTKVWIVIETNKGNMILAGSSEIEIDFIHNEDRQRRLDTYALIMHNHIEGRTVHATLSNKGLRVINPIRGFNHTYIIKISPKSKYATLLKPWTYVMVKEQI